MKEIKAYIQRCCVNETVNQLEAAGAPGITVAEIHPVGHGYKPNDFETHFKDALKRSSAELPGVLYHRQEENLHHRSRL